MPWQPGDFHYICQRASEINGEREKLGRQGVSQMSRTICKCCLVRELEPQLKFMPWGANTIYICSQHLLPLFIVEEKKRMYTYILT